MVDKIRGSKGSPDITPGCASIYCYRAGVSGVMKESAKQYYAELRNGYAVRIRQLVPKYDDMIRCILDLLKLSSPVTVLDLSLIHI